MKPGQRLAVACLLGGLAFGGLASAGLLLAGILCIGPLHLAAALGSGRQGAP